MARGRRDSSLAAAMACRRVGMPQVITPSTQLVTISRRWRAGGAWAHAKAPLATPCVTVHQLNTSLEDPQVLGQRHLVLRVHKNQILDEEQADDVLPFSGIHRHPREAVVKNVPHHRKTQLTTLLEHVGIF